MQKKRFHMRSMLAVITGLSEGAPHFAELQGIFDFLNSGGIPGNFQERNMLKKHLLEQFPGLVKCEECLSPTEISILKRGVDHNEIRRILSDWIAQQVQIHGEYFEVSVPS